jgi:hypothetical protein
VVISRLLLAQSGETQQITAAVRGRTGGGQSADAHSLRPGGRRSASLDLGAEIAVGGRLDPRVLGDAARSERYDQQALKRVWHCVARFGTRHA